MPRPLTPSELDFVIETLRVGGTIGTGAPGYSEDYRFATDRWVQRIEVEGEVEEHEVDEACVRAFVVGHPGMGAEIVLAPYWRAHATAVRAGDTCAALAALDAVPDLDTTRIAQQWMAVHRWPEPPTAEALRLLRANADAAMLLVAVFPMGMANRNAPGDRARAQAWLARVEAILDEPLPRERAALAFIPG